MKFIKIFSLFLFILMLCSVSYGIMKGNFLFEGEQILNLLWGKITIVDFYVGISLFSIWVVFRESSLLKAVVWIISLVLLGNLTASLYVLIAAFKSKDDWKTFILGKQ
ncbi:DUF1475 family protein [Bacillus carboniphilus]|uniref:DUF1475 family protein n=1 Tax=Bacillus carboniphilus TaxID=86663 RepID=A0ABY9JTF3_9BACI|nr:DUF1475 family protein [Bacillus carboniphilus]WLR42682.1 DUF1475 family protein [Bacillus carboniphilus]